MPTRNSPIAFAAALVCSALTAGCYTYEPMRVQVRAAATGAPVVGAVVEAAPINAGGLTTSRSLIGVPSMPNSARGETGSQGWVDLPMAIEDPMQIRIAAPGLAPFSYMLDRHPAIAGPTDWLSIDAPDGTPPPPYAMLVRFSSPSTKP